MFQECGNHTTVREREVVRTKFMESLRLDEHSDLEVHQSYWTLWKRRTVKIVSAGLRPCPGNVSTREWQTAQVLVVEPVLQGDAADSRVTFVNLHLPSSQKRKLNTDKRKAHFRAACRGSSWETRTPLERIAGHSQGKRSLPAENSCWRASPERRRSTAGNGTSRASG